MSSCRSTKDNNRQMKETNINRLTCMNKINFDNKRVQTNV